MLATRVALGTIAAFMIAGCTVNAPIDPSDIFGPFSSAVERAQRNLEDALADPFHTNPWPVLIGGNSQRIVYATNLADVQIRFPGPTNDITLPGITGPSNVYVYENGQRQLVRPLVPSSALLSLLSSDGDSVAYVSYSQTESGYTQTVFVGTNMLGLLSSPDHAIYSAPADSDLVVTGVRLSEGRVAVLVTDLASETGSSVLVYDANSDAAPLELQTVALSGLDLRGSRLAYVAPTANAFEVRLADLATGSDITVSTEIAAPQTLYLSDNRAVWSREAGDSLSTIIGFDIPTGIISVVRDAVPGVLAGASDAAFATEETNVGRNGITERHEVVLYAADAAPRVLGDFRADGLSGQTAVLSDRVVFVNATGKIVVVPLGRGDRFNFEPF